MRLIKFILILSMLVSVISPLSAFAANKKEISVAINDYILPLPHKAYMINGVPMVVLDDICIPLQTTSKLEGNSIHIYREQIGADMLFTLGSDLATVLGDRYKLKAVPFKEGEDIYIPLDAFCDACKYEMSIDGELVNIYTTGKEILKWLKRYDEFVGKDALDFVLHQYDPETGGFYFAPSTRDTEGFGTDIESTEQALTFLTSGKPQGYYSEGLASVLPQEFKEKIVKFAQERQDETDGYFYNEWQGHNVDIQKRERDLSRGVALIEWFGGKPLYKLPSERIIESKSESNEPKKLSSAYDFVSSEQAFIKWLNSYDWTKNAYGAGSIAASSINTIHAAGLMDEAIEFFKSIQNTETGLWGEGYTYDCTNAAMKIGCFFTRDTEPYPYLDLMIDSVIKTMKSTDEPETICEIWNPLYALIGATESHGAYMNEDLRAYIDSQLPALMEITYKNLIQYKQKDGGTSYYKSGSRSVHHGSVIGLGQKESDMDAILIGTMQIRTYFYNLARFSFIPPVYEQYSEYITNYFETAKPIEREAVLPEITEDFESSEYKLPAKLTPTQNVGNVTIVDDPAGADNKVLKLDTVSGGLTAFSYSVNLPSNAQKTVFECDIYVDNLTAGSTFYNPIGNYGVQWCISSADGKTFTLSARPNQTGTGTAFKRGLAMGRWYHIKIVYEPRGIADTKSTYYVNGKLCKRTNIYFYDNDAKRLPQKDIKSVEFKSFSSAVGTIYVDNLYVKTV